MPVCQNMWSFLSGPPIVTITYLEVFRWMKSSRACVISNARCYVWCRRNFCCASLFNGEKRPPQGLVMSSPISSVKLWRRFIGRHHLFQECCWLLVWKVARHVIETVFTYNFTRATRMSVTFTSGHRNLIFCASHPQKNMRTVGMCWHFCSKILYSWIIVQKSFFVMPSTSTSTFVIAAVVEDLALSNSRLLGSEYKIPTFFFFLMSSL